MNSSAVQASFLDEKTKNNTIEFIKKFQQEHIKYFSLQGEWKFSKSEIHGPEHLYLFLRKEFKSNTSLEPLIKKFITEICEKNGSSFVKEKLTPEALFHGIHCNFSISPYFIRIQHGVCLDGIIQASSEFQQFKTFLLCTHYRVGEKSSIRKFVTSTIYDRNSLYNIFTFFPGVSEKPNVISLNGQNQNKRKR